MASWFPITDQGKSLDDTQASAAGMAGEKIITPVWLGIARIIAPVLEK